MLYTCTNSEDGSFRSTTRISNFGFAEISLLKFPYVYLSTSLRIGLCDIQWSFSMTLLQYFFCTEENEVIEAIYWNFRNNYRNSCPVIVTVLLITFLDIQSEPSASKIELLFFIIIRFQEQYLRGLCLHSFFVKIKWFIIHSCFNKRIMT